MSLSLTRPRSRADFDAAIICALPLEADAVEALFDHCWDHDGPPFGKAVNDPNSYTTGAFGKLNMVIAHMPEAGKASSAVVASNCRASFPNIQLGLVVGICGAIPFDEEEREIVLGDVLISDSVVQYDLGRQNPHGFTRKSKPTEALGRPNIEMRSTITKLNGLTTRRKLQKEMIGFLEVLRKDPELGAKYPGPTQDRLFESSYCHMGTKMCQQAGCNGQLIPRARLEVDDVQPLIHVGTIGSGDTVFKSGEHRDALAQSESVIGFEMEVAGVWECFPVVVMIKGACDYADSHKNWKWQRYAAATSAACTKAFVAYWLSSKSFGS